MTDLQRTDAWQDRRRGKWTGTSFADVMSQGRGNQPSVTRQKCIKRIALERITGRTKPTFQSPAMLRGSELEPFAASAYEAEYGVILTQIEFADHPLLPYVGCSPDRILSEVKGVEIKCPEDEAHWQYLTTDQFLSDYKWQMQGQMWVMGWEELDAVSFNPDWPAELQLAVRTVKRDQDLIDQLASEVEKAEAEVNQLINQINEMRNAA